MNWMGAICFLIGVAMGIEIAYLAMKNRCEVVRIRETNKRLEILRREAETLKNWRETINLNDEIHELNKELIDEIEELRKQLYEKDCGGK